MKKDTLASGGLSLITKEDNELVNLVRQMIDASKNYSQYDVNCSEDSWLLTMHKRWVDKFKEALNA